MKKILYLTFLISLLIFVNNCAGYKPIFGSTSLQFEISNYDIQGDKILGNKLYSKLYNLSKSKKVNSDTKNLDLLINVSNTKSATSKDSSGKILEYKIKNKVNQLILDEFPFKIDEIIEKVNISLLKLKYNDQSKVLVGDYKIDINSREISYKDKKLKLTEREIDIILFLKNTQNPKSIENLQKEVWGHNSNLETHTVETHIYRLRKKIKDIFKNEKFIMSTKKGYIIK